MSNDFIAPPLPILSFGSVGPSELPFPNYSIPISNEVSEDPTTITLQHVAQAVLKAKRVTVLCGAGISCASGIPDFRSTEGLFESLKKQYPEAKLTSGKDLFDASLFSSEANAAIFYTMISELKTMADAAEPTAFHRFLKSLDDEGKLHRVYTQNIDGLEERAGLSYGLGSKAPPTPRRKSCGPPSPVKSPTKKPTRSSRNITPPSGASTPSSSLESTSSTPPPRPPPIPKCIPLHGHLSTLSCPHCSHTISITPHLPLLATGNTLICPACSAIDEARSAVGERSRGVGMMKPDVVLYGETHREGERVGEITRKDLMGVRPDLLLVVGTTLKVPGTKLLVRELAKVIRPAWTWTKGEIDGEEEEEDEMPVASGSTSVSIDSSTGEKKSSNGGGRRKRKPDKVSVIYLNYEFPKPSSEWKDVFDVWMRGDVQEFVELVEEERKAEESRRVKKLEEKEEMLKRREEKERKKIEKELLSASQQSSSSTSSSSTIISTAKKTTTKSRVVKPKLVGPRPKPVPKVKSTTGAGAVRKVPVKRNSTVKPKKEVVDVEMSDEGESAPEGPPTPRKKHPHQFSLQFITNKPFAPTTGQGKRKELMFN